MADFGRAHVKEYFPELLLPVSLSPRWAIATPCLCRRLSNTSRVIWKIKNCAVPLQSSLELPPKFPYNSFRRFAFLNKVIYYSIWLLFSCRIWGGSIYHWVGTFTFHIRIECYKLPPDTTLVTSHNCHCLFITFNFKKISFSFLSDFFLDMWFN